MLENKEDVNKVKRGRDVNCHPVGVSVMMWCRSHCSCTAVVGLWRSELMFYLEWSSLMSSRQRSGMWRPPLCHLITIPKHRSLSVSVGVCVCSSISLSVWARLAGSVLLQGNLASSHHETHTCTHAQWEWHVSNEGRGIKDRGCAPWAGRKNDDGKGRREVRRDRNREEGRRRDGAGVLTVQEPLTPPLSN